MGQSKGLCGVWSGGINRQEPGDERLLRNPKHDRFAQELAKGKTLEEAHRVAGYSGNRKTGSQLRQRPDISGRVAEILAAQERISEKATQKAI